MSTTRIITLGQYIELLENLCDVHGKDFKIPLGFGEPISWRGNYQDLALPSKHNTTLGKMLIDAQSAVGEVTAVPKSEDFFTVGDAKIFIQDVLPLSYAEVLARFSIRATLSDIKTYHGRLIFRWTPLEDLADMAKESEETL